MMTHPMPVIADLSPEAARATAQEWGERALSLTQAARACCEVAEFLEEAGGMLLAAADVSARQSIVAASVTSTLPSGVADLAAYRARRQAASR